MEDMNVHLELLIGAKAFNYNLISVCSNMVSCFEISFFYWQAEAAWKFGLSVGSSRYKIHQQSFKTESGKLSEQLLIEMSAHHF